MMKKALGITVAVAAGVGVGALVGVLPTLPSARVAERPFDPAAAVPRVQEAPVETAVPPAPNPDAGAESAVDAGAPLPEPEPVAEAEVCEAPGYGSALHTLKLNAAGETCLVVWCRGGYALLSVAELGSGTPRLERLGFFSTRSEAPGGAASGDFDADGLVDLVLGVAPRPPLVHRAGAGVFFLRGRKEGGFEAPRPLVETPTIALSRRPLARGDGLWVLTRGEPAAQRPGELWLFAPAALPSRVAVLPGVVDPRDWLIQPKGHDDATLWLVSGDPGALVRVRVHGSAELTEPRLTLAVRGAQGWVHGSGDERALLRDGASLLSVELTADAPVATPFAAEVRVGPAALIDVDGDAQPEVLAALPEGAAFVDAAGAVRELGLPRAAEVAAVGIVADDTGRAHPVLLRRPRAAGEQLGLLFPSPRAAPGTPLRAVQVPVVEPAMPFVIALE
jgi:hypothetical protein